jgi:hypothetical protein
MWIKTSKGRYNLAGAWHVAKSKSENTLFVDFENGASESIQLPEEEIDRILARIDEYAFDSRD